MTAAALLAAIEAARAQLAAIEPDLHSDHGTGPSPATLGALPGRASDEQAESREREASGCATATRDLPGTPRPDLSGPLPMTPPTSGVRGLYEQPER